MYLLYIEIRISVLEIRAYSFGVTASCMVEFVASVLCGLRFGSRPTRNMKLSKKYGQGPAKSHVYSATRPSQPSRGPNLERVLCWNPVRIQDVQDGDSGLRSNSHR